MWKDTSGYRSGEYVGREIMYVSLIQTMFNFA